MRIHFVWLTMLMNICLPGGLPVADGQTGLPGDRQTNAANMNYVNIIAYLN